MAIRDQEGMVLSLDLPVLWMLWMLLHTTM